MPGDHTYEQIVLGGGCFWCLDAVYRQVKGVIRSECGYSGGSTVSPTYEQVCTGTTGHAEVVRVTFDSLIVSLAQILDVFFAMHDPTSLNRQGADTGTEYRSVILYTHSGQLAVTNGSLTKHQSNWNKPIVTQVEPLTIFYIAEDYHQDFFSKNPTSGYCYAVIKPKLNKPRQGFKPLLRSYEA